MANDGLNGASIPVAPAAIALSGLFILYGYLLWSRPSQRPRTATRLGDYLASQRAARSTTPFYSSSAAYSLQRAVNTFAYFEDLSQQALDATVASYGKLSARHKALGDAIGYATKLKDIRAANEANSRLTRSFVKFAWEETGTAGVSMKDAELNRGREALKHLVRDWSEDGKSERDMTHQPILDILRSQPQRGRVLVPGCGMGRLAWEISKLGYSVTANEYSHFMTLPLRFLLSEKYTEIRYQHSVQPYYFTLSHNRAPADLFRSVSFPDDVPRLSKSFNIQTGDFYGLTDHGKYNAVVTLFFIDTSVNIVDCLQQIYDLLVPGGLWINLGPILWTSGSVSRMELSLQEILSLADLVGFELQPGRKQVNTEYTANTSGMMRYVYEAEFWVARKVA